jgi:hydroxymethylglutaryl-CoA synthase
MFVRDNRDILGLFGARCIECGTVNFPPAIHPSCVGCGGDKFDEVALARTGTVQTFVINHTMPAPFVAPLPLVCVDLVDGSRVMFQGVGDGEGIEIGAPVRLVLRRYTVERGVPVYGWKVAPTTEAFT